LILAPGQPDAVSPDRLKLVYRSEKVSGWLFIGFPGGGHTAPILKDIFLVAEFEKNGILQDLQPSHTWSGPGGRNGILPIIVTKNRNSVRLQYYTFSLDCQTD
jgi:hypothetical protein